MVPLGGDLSKSSQTRSDEYAAWGIYHNRLDNVGWGSLMMHTSTAQEPDDGVKMYAAGAVEGFLTARRIIEFYNITRQLLAQNQRNLEGLPKALQARVILLRAQHMLIGVRGIFYGKIRL